MINKTIDLDFDILNSTLAALDGEVALLSPGSKVEVQLIMHPSSAKDINTRVIDARVLVNMTRRALMKAGFSIEDMGIFVGLGAPRPSDQLNIKVVQG